MATVGEVMSRNLLTVDPATPLAAAAERTCDRGAGAALVPSNDHVSGILTERDDTRPAGAGGGHGTHAAAWPAADPQTRTAAGHARTASPYV